MIGEGEILWSEIYRPHKISDCIIPDTIKKIFQQYVDSKQIPTLMLIGSSGTGKTSAAKAMCDEIGADYIFINGSLENGIDLLRTKIQGFGSSVSFTGGRKVIIVDEADNLTHPAQLALRGVMEELSKNCSFIFTCNHKNRIMKEIHSRCATVEFKLLNKDKTAMAVAFLNRVFDILKKENVTYDKNVIVELIKKYFPDYRKILNELQKYSVATKTIDIGVLSAVQDAKFDELIRFIKNKDFTNLRRWAGQNSDNDPLTTMRYLYDNMSTIFTLNTLPVLVVLTGKYMYQASFCADQEINLVAYLTEVMCDCEFK